MQAFEYATPTKKEQIAVLLGDNGSVLAGGTDLLALIKDDIVTPKRLVNIKQIDGLRGVSYQPNSGLRIGALTTVAELSDNATVRQNYLVLTESAVEAASPQIRNLATIGGNMCQRPRCWYFRNGMGLLAMKDGNRWCAQATTATPPFSATTAPRSSSVPRPSPPCSSSLARRFASTLRKPPVRACASWHWRSSSSFLPRRASASTTSSPTRSLPRSSCLHRRRT